MTEPQISFEAHYIEHDCQVCDDPDPPAVSILDVNYVVAGERKNVSMRCCDRCRVRIEECGLEAVLGGEER